MVQSDLGLTTLEFLDHWLHCGEELGDISIFEGCLLFVFRVYFFGILTGGAVGGGWLLGKGNAEN